MWLDPRRYEIMDDDTAHMLRGKTPDERLAIAEGLWRMARDLISDKIRHDHPDWLAEQIASETARRLQNGAG
jgi:hypothetical protein